MPKPISPVAPGMDLPEMVFGKDQPEYLPLPAVKLADGTVVTRWHLTFKERLQVLLGGSIWLSQLTFGHKLQPLQLAVKNPIVLAPGPVDGDPNAPQ